jgi:uncharacterized membrane protein
MSEQQPQPAPSTPPPPTTPASTPPAGGTGLQQNVAGLLCYVLGWVTGIVFLILESKNSFVRFHAIQSIVFFGAVTIVDIILWGLAFIPFIGVLFVVLYWLIGVFGFIMWILLMVRAYQGKMWKLPIAGNIAEKNSKPAA